MSPSVTRCLNHPIMLLINLPPLVPSGRLFFIFISYMWGRAVGVLIFVWFSVTWLVLILHFLCYAGRGGGLLVRQFLDFAAISLIRWFAQIELFSEVWICISWDLISSIVILLPDSWGSFDFCLLVLKFGWVYAEIYFAGIQSSSSSSFEVSLVVCCICVARFSNSIYWWSYFWVLSLCPLPILWAF